MANEQYIIKSKSENGFWRCGKHFTKSGVIVSEVEFSKEQWERLKGEPMLRVEPVKPGDVENTAERQAALIEAMRSLGVDGFQKDGKPKSAVLQAALDDDFGKVTAQERDAAWDVLQADENYTSPLETAAAE